MKPPSFIKPSHKIIWIWGSCICQNIYHCFLDCKVATERVCWEKKRKTFFFKSINPHLCFSSPSGPPESDFQHISATIMHLSCILVELKISKKLTKQIKSKQNKQTTNNKPQQRCSNKGGARGRGGWELSHCLIHERVLPLLQRVFFKKICTFLYVFCFDFYWRFVHFKSATVRSFFFSHLMKKPNKLGLPQMQEMRDLKVRNKIGSCGPVLYLCVCVL